MNLVYYLTPKIITGTSEYVLVLSNANSLQDLKNACAKHKRLIMTHAQENVMQPRPLWQGFISLKRIIIQLVQPSDLCLIDIGFGEIKIKHKIWRYITELIQLQVYLSYWTLWFMGQLNQKGYRRPGHLSLRMIQDKDGSSITVLVTISELILRIGSRVSKLIREGSIFWVDL